MELSNLVVSEFHSNEDLGEARIASSNIPIIATTCLGQHFRGMRVFDGGLTNNLPCFHDGRRRQLVCDLSRVAYPVTLTLSPSDTCIESLVLRGAFEMRHFALAGCASGLAMTKRAISWYDSHGRGSPGREVCLLPS